MLASLLALVLLAEEADTSAKFISHRGINSLKKISIVLFSRPFIQRTTTPDHLKNMGEREDNVYKAKLAEQAERYELEHINVSQLT